MQYIIGIDAGGTSSKGVSYTIEGAVLDRKEEAFGNFAVDINKTKEHLESLIDNFILDNSENQLAGIYIGASGIGSYSKKEEYRVYLEQKYNTHIELISDIQLAKEASLLGEDGVLVILGTGFACLGSHQGKELLYGGWGHIIGDPCSGYAIGLASIRTLIREYENQKMSDFSTIVMQFFKIDNVNAIKEIVYQYPKEKVASIAKKIISIMGENSTAFSIIVDEINSMVTTVERLCETLGFKEELHLVLMGSIAANLPMIKAIMEANLMYEIIWHEAKEASFGAYYLHKKYLME